MDYLELKTTLPLAGLVTIPIIYRRDYLMLFLSRVPTTGLPMNAKIEKLCYTSQI